MSSECLWRFLYITVVGQSYCLSVVHVEVTEAVLSSLNSKSQGEMRIYFIVSDIYSMERGTISFSQSEFQKAFFA
jgi:hypothetical protein